MSHAQRKLARLQLQDRAIESGSSWRMFWAGVGLIKIRRLRRERDA